MFPLLIRYWDKALLGIAIVALVGMCRARDHALVEKGKAEQSEAQFRQRNERLISANDSLMRAFKVDTLRLTKWMTKWDTIASKPDTVPVEVIVAVADSTIQACSVTVQTCSRALAAKDSLAESREKLHAASLRQIKSQHRVEVIKWSVISLLLGTAVAALQMH
jgi:hypothetical protein